MFAEALIRVADDPRAELFTAQADGPDDRALLVVHGGPDWDHRYQCDLLHRPTGMRRVVMAALRTGALRRLGRPVAARGAGPTTTARSSKEENTVRGTYGWKAAPNAVARR